MTWTEADKKPFREKLRCINCNSDYENKSDMYSYDCSLCNEKEFITVGGDDDNDFQHFDEIFERMHLIKCIKCDELRCKKCYHYELNPGFPCSKCVISMIHSDKKFNEWFIFNYKTRDYDGKYNDVIVQYVSHTIKERNKNYENEKKRAQYDYDQKMKQFDDWTTKIKR